MIKSKGPGRVRAITSVGRFPSSPIGNARPIHPTTSDKATAARAPSSSPHAAFWNMGRRPVTEASETPRMGDINGATSMAPMITAAEFSSRPSVAITQDRRTRTK